MSIAEETGAGYAIRSATDVQPEDWVDRSDPFFRAVETLCSGKVWVIDLHGMSDDYGVDMCLGRGPKPEAAQEPMIGLFTRHFPDLTVSIDEPFSGRPSHTILSYISSQRATGLQVEISARWRDPIGSPKEAALLAEGLVSVVDALSLAHSDLK